MAFITVPSPGAEQSPGKVAMVTAQAGLAAAMLGAAGLQVTIPTTVTVQLPGAQRVFPRIPLLQGVRGLGPANTPSGAPSGAADSSHRDVDEGAE